MESSKLKSKTKGKRKMEESSIEDKKEDTRSYFTWNLEMERVLADVLRDQRSLGRKSDGAWKAVAYNTAAQVLSARFKVQLIGENVKNRIKLWRGCKIFKYAFSSTAIEDLSTRFLNMRFLPLAVLSANILVAFKLGAQG